MPSSLPRRLTCLVAVAVAVALAAGAAPAHAQERDDVLPGYTEEGSAAQRAYEERFSRGVSAESIGRVSRRLTRRPQRVGTEGARRAAQISIQRLRRSGLDARTRSYDVYLSTPRDIRVTMTAPTRRELAVKERPFDYQGKSYDEVVVGYNAYSPAGDVTGEVVYANYGRPQDFAALDSLGVSVRDKIVLVRYGQNFRGVKSRQAELRGARGVIIYSDPEDSGFVRGPVYPEGPGSRRTPSSAEASSTSSSTRAIRSPPSRPPCRAPRA